MLGIFDSGVGGLSVVRELLRQFPRASFLYLGDTARTPYGNKSPETIRQYAEEDARFLIAHGATAIIAACNTVSSVAMEHLRSAFPETVFFDVVEPAVEAVAKGESKKIGVIGTRATIASGVYEKCLKDRAPHTKVLSVACPLFVPLVEENWIRKPETKRIARAYLQPLRQKQMDAIILGCTHYPFLREVIRASLQRRVHMVDSASCAVDRVKRDAPSQLQGSDAPCQEYFFTDITEQTKIIANRWIGKKVVLQRATL